MKRKTRATPAGVSRSRCRFPRRERRLWFLNDKYRNKQGYCELREEFLQAMVVLISRPMVFPANFLQVTDSLHDGKQVGVIHYVSKSPTVDGEYF